MLKLGMGQGHEIVYEGYIQVGIVSRREVRIDQGYVDADWAMIQGMPWPSIVHLRWPVRTDLCVTGVWSGSDHIQT